MKKNKRNRAKTFLFCKLNFKIIVRLQGIPVSTDLK